MRLFGTDGVRGKANTELTPELIMRLGRAAVSSLATEAEQPLIYIGSDTRISGDMLRHALSAGCMSAGASVVDLGVLPTPALAYLTRNSKAHAGAMISASHNPAVDNGIKFFSRDGFKLPDEVEDHIEALVQGNEGLRVAGDKVGTYTRDDCRQQEYLEYLKNIAQVDLQGMKIVVDGANGAAYQLGPALFEALGAEVVPISISPDGLNINVKAGSTYPEAMTARVRESGAHLGLAFDGDADRLIACDSKGNLVDGDNILHICASYLHGQGALQHSTVVGTVMSNLGLDAVLRREDIQLLRAPVGDRYVLQEMLSSGARLGGEQSGHCIFLGLSTTGDGLLTAVMLLKAIVAKGATLDSLVAELKRFPQVLINVPVRDKRLATEHQNVREAIVRAETALRDRGRILVRSSGTEAIVRVMVEAETEELAKSSADIVVMALKTVSA